MIELRNKGKENNSLNMQPASSQQNEPKFSKFILNFSVVTAVKLSFCVPYETLFNNVYQIEETRNCNAHEIQCDGDLCVLARGKFQHV